MGLTLSLSRQSPEPLHQLPVAICVSRLRCGPLQLASGGRNIADRKIRRRISGLERAAGRRTGERTDRRTWTGALCAEFSAPLAAA